MRYVAPIFTAILIFGCTSEGSNQTKSADSSLQPVSVSKAQFQNLEWLEGTWHGTGGKAESFYETYQFVNDTTIKFEVYNDSSFTQTNYKGKITLSDDTLILETGPNAWRVTSITDTKIHFEPWKKVKNTFTWTKKSSDEWKGVVRYPQAGKQDLELKYIRKRISNR